MVKQVEIRVPPEKIEDPKYIRIAVQRKLNLKEGRQFQPVIIRRSIDARKAPAVYALRVDVYFNEKPPKPAKILDRLRDVSGAPIVHIVGRYTY